MRKGSQWHFANLFQISDKIRTYVNEIDDGAANINQGATLQIHNCELCTEFYIPHDKQRKTRKRNKKGEKTVLGVILEKKRQGCQ